MSEAKDRTHWVGVDLGGTKTLVTVFDHAFEKVGETRKKTKGQKGQEAGLERVVKTIHAGLDAAGIGPDQVAGIGVGCPGPLDLDRGVVLEMPNLGWKKTPVRKLLKNSFGCPAVISNDVDAGLYGEYRFGAARGARCALGVFPGTGIGGGCVYEGRILRGKTGSCMEIGHIPVDPDGPLCGCGQRGCLEAMASRLSIASAAATAAHRGEAPHLLGAAGTDLSRIRSGALAASIAAGDEAVGEIVRHAAHLIGRATATAVNLLAPDVVVLGGGLVEALPELVHKEVEKAAKTRVMPSFRKSFRVVVAELGDDATATGAAAWAQQFTGNSHR